VGAQQSGKGFCQPLRDQVGLGLRPGIRIPAFLTHQLGELRAVLPNEKGGDDWRPSIRRRVSVPVVSGRARR
jgi:hypothetical protein